MNRDDVVRITETVVQGLSLKMKYGYWTDPNTRTVELIYKGEVISSVDFDVVQKEEYEG